MRGTLLGIVVVLLAAMPAAAAVIDIDVGGGFRQVAAAAGINGAPANGDLDNTSATGIWSATVAAFMSNPCPCPPDGGGGSASASASQISNLGDFEISMSGVLSVGATEGYAADAQSFLSAQFSLASDSPYFSSLSSSGPTVNFSFSNRSGQPIGANSNGALPAGEYNLTINFQSSTALSNSGPYSYNLLIVPEPSTAVLILVGGLLVASRRTKLSITRSRQRRA